MMRKSISGYIPPASPVIVCCVLAWATGLCAAQSDDLSDTWLVMRRANVDSPQYVQAQGQLRWMLEQLPPDERTAAAAKLMDRYAGDSVNVAAIRLFGRDPLPASAIGAIVSDPKRGWAKRVLVRVYYSLCRAGYMQGQLSEAARLELVDVLTGRLTALTGRPVTYGEQRLLTHLCQSVLSRHAGQVGKLARADRLIEAMRSYAASAEAKDVLAMSVRGWLDLIGNPLGPVSSMDEAVRAVGHWDGLTRWQGQRFLGTGMARRPDLAEAVWQMLGDPRDEVREAAVMAFAVADKLEPERVVAAMVNTLVSDRGVTVQAAAGATLSVRAGQATTAINPLLDAFKPAAGKRRPGVKRTGSILSALAAVAGRADANQRRRMLALAREKLATSPSGSLELLAALGPDAREALEQVEGYRHTADRFERHYIDRHVVPAITFGQMAMPER